MEKLTPTTTELVTATHLPSRRIKLIIAASIAGAILVCVLAGLAGIALYKSLTHPNPTTTSTLLTPTTDGNKAATQEEEDIAGVAAKVGPSVVSIVTTSTTNNNFYGTTQQEGAGTGIIVSSDGYILTNKHVVSGATTVQVILADGTTYDNVKVLGSDPLNDVAFLKIPDVSSLTAAVLGDSSSVRIGQKVVAIGNSLGQYQNTVTSGIISGTGRPVSASADSSSNGEVENLTDLLQTDAAINPGNSGGPLLNLSGQVIGINTAIAEDAQGIGFSIPINATKGILKGVLANQKVSRAFLGVNYLSITPDVASKYNLSVKKGAYVHAGSGTTAVQSGSPADKAGLKDGDIITKVNDSIVGDNVGVASLIAAYAPRDNVQLTILRDGKTMTVSVALAAYAS